MGAIRVRPEDFQVAEKLSFEPNGEGPHCFLYLQKTGCNSAWVARQLAELAACSERDVGYAGQKDRHGVTRQWFSVPLSAETWTAELPDGIELLEQTRNQRKLKRGALSGNHFRIRVSDLDGDTSGLEESLQRISSDGFPNYFGPQRFGIDGSNLQRALDWFAGGRKPRNRQARSFALSAARAFLFNRLLAWRVQAGNWNQLVAGELAQLAGSRSVFPVEQTDERIPQRLAAGDIHPSGPLWGRGDAGVSGEIADCEEKLRVEYADLCAGLEAQGLKQERRSLRVIPGDLQWKIEAEQFTLELFLPRGSFATTLLREIADCRDAQTVRNKDY